MEARGLNGLFQRRVRLSGPNGALRYKMHGRWVEWTWNDMMEKVRLISQGLRALGVEKGDKIGLYAGDTPRVEFSPIWEFWGQEGLPFPSITRIVRWNVSTSSSNAR